jgi:hypothetical protein
MTLILDAGALVAIERGDRDVVALLKREYQAGRVPKTHGAIVGQVWRGGSGRQARLTRVLPGLEIVPLDDALGRRAGVLLGRARTSDVVDAAVVVLAADGDVVLTSDVDDIAHLTDSAGLDVDVVPV